jgi:hypothetical protein
VCCKAAQPRQSRLRPARQQNYNNTNAHRCIISSLAR